MTLTETQWRQRELSKKINKYIDGYYSDYYMDDGGRIIVFVKKMKCSIKKNCCCLAGLDCVLQSKTEKEKIENI